MKKHERIVCFLSSLFALFFVLPFFTFASEMTFLDHSEINGIISEGFNKETVKELYEGWCKSSGCSDKYYTSVSNSIAEIDVTKTFLDDFISCGKDLDKYLSSQENVHPAVYIPIVSEEKKKNAL